MSDKPVDKKPIAGLDTTAAAISEKPRSSGSSGSTPTITYAGQGDQLGEYSIIAFIAEGSFGSVYRATHPKLGTVALKVSHLATTKLSMQRLTLLHNEVEALVQIRHPSLVQVLDHGTLEDKRSYLAFALIEGENLQSYLDRRGRLDAIEAIQIVRRLAEGIAHCHQFKILHLDLAPKNVILVDAHASEVKIVDFGVAAFAENWLDREQRPMAGTPLYMAPEMHGDQKIGPHCDVYALGLIFFQLLTGRIPFVGGSSGEIFGKKMRGERPTVKSLVPDVPPAIEAVIDVLLQPEPAQRTFTAASLASHLKQLYFEILGRSNATMSGPIAIVTSQADERNLPLIGRNEEVAPLLARAREALSGTGEGWALLLSGDPGIGKSRVLAEMSHRLQLGRDATGYGRCRQHANLVSYAPWRECLGQLVNAVEQHKQGDGARHAMLELLADPAVVDLFALVPELEAMRGQPNELAMPTSSDVGSKRVSAAVSRLVTAVCAHVPVALVLEDLHWADQGTIDILGALVAAPLPPGLLIMCTARPEAPLPEWPHLVKVQLDPLDEARSAELVRALAGDISPEVMAQLTTAIPLFKMGNPLVDIQLILHLQRDGVLTRGEDGKVVLAERVGKGYDAPTSVSSVLERRLRDVPGQAREVLGIAALVGRQFSVSDLHAICAPELAVAEIDAAVEQAVELALVRAPGTLGDNEHVFVHDVIRDHLESTVPAARLADLHARIARTLFDRAPAATLAYHLDRAGDRAAAAAQYAEGGIEADRVHDLVGSSKNLRRACALYLALDSSPERDRALARATYELARITCLLGKTQEPLQDLESARVALVDPPPAAAAMLDSAYARVYYAQGKFAEAMEHSQKALAVTDSSLGPYQCVPANMLGRALCASGHFGASVDVLRRGCQLARETNDLVELSHSAGLLGTALAFTGDLVGSQAAIAEASFFAEQLKNPARRMGVCLYQALQDEAASRWEDGMRAAAKLLAQSEEYAMAGLYLYLGTMVAGRHTYHLGQMQRARHLLMNALNLSSVFSITTCKSWGQTYLGDIYFCENRHDAALRWYETALETARVGRGDGHGVPLALIGSAHANAALGTDPAQVHELAEESFRAFDASSNATGLAVGLVRYLDALELMGETGERREKASARLSGLLQIIGAPVSEFWPVIPSNAAPADRSMTPRDYWCYRGGAVIAEEKITVQKDEVSDVLVRLSTVDGYVPEYASVKR